MKNLAIGLLIVAFALITPLAMAQSTWTLDPAHSAAQFQVKHLMISTVRGEFTKMSGKLAFNGRSYSTLQAEAEIETGSINTREPKRDNHLRSADFFDAAAFPKIIFKSTRVTDVQGNNFKLIGALTIRGITKEITLNVEASPIIKGMNGETRIGAQATGKLNRQDFGVKWNKSLDSGGVVVGDEVKITLDLEFIQAAK
jgi:polyisoprenoid-binding protein YceI